MSSAHTADWHNPGSIRAISTRLQRLLRQRTGCAEEARDLVQDAWLRLLEQGEHTRPREPAAWLHTVAHNLCVDQQRQRQSAARHGLYIGAAHAADGANRSDRADLADPQTDPASAQPPWLHQPDAAESLMYAQAIDAVDAALQALPRRVRDIFLAQRLHGTSQAELAARHGISLATVERDMQQATARVQAALLHWRGDSPAASAPGRRRHLGALLGVAGLGASGLIGWQLWQRIDAQPAWQLALHTPRGKTLRQTLPDGSALSLDADSRAHIRYHRRSRHVQLLQGAVFASVQPDSARPFVLQARLSQTDAATSQPAPSARITVLGTRFSADLGPAGLRVRVAQGSVRVEWLAPQGSPRSQHTLGSGQGLLLSAHSPAPTLLASATPDQDPDTHAAPWQQGQLRFDAEPLAHAIQRLARYQPEGSPPIVLDPRVQHLTVSGQMPLRHAHDWLQSLPAILPVSVQRQGQSLHIGPRGKG